MLGKNHITVGLGALPIITGQGLEFLMKSPTAVIAYLIGVLINDIDGDGGNALIVQTFSFKVKGVLIQPLKPVSIIIYNLFGHRAMMHYPEVWLLFSFLLYQLGTPLLLCYFFFLGTLIHLSEDGITVGGLPVPPTIKYLIVAPIRALYFLVKKKPLKSIPMLWERKGFPPPNSNGGKVTFQDLIYENRLFLLPKKMRFKVGGPMETVAVVIIMTIFFMVIDPFGNLQTPNEPIYNTFKNINDSLYSGVQKSYDFFSFLRSNSGGIEQGFSDTIKTLQNK